jgi:type IV pilus assembly protein PilV
MKRYAPRSQRGVSLIEVMVAIVVFGIGLLGLGLMQMKGAQFTKEAGSRGNVVVQVRSLMDAMRSNSTAALLPIKAADPAAPTSTECPYCYSGSGTLTSVDCSSGCNAAKSARRDLYLWTERLKKAAPGPAGTGPRASVTWNSNLGMYVVTATWSAGGLDGSTSSADDQTYTLNYLP